MKQVVVLGISHDSPACARIVADTIERLRPSHVMIEGPADFTDMLPDLTREHALPIAVFSHVRRGGATRVGWTAFTDFSPEWVALRAASSVGADIRFIDLPTWDPEFDSSPTLYGPRAVALAARLGIETMGAVWDHVIESRAFSLPPADLSALVDGYFDAIRSIGVEASPREQYMTAWVRAARDRRDSGSVVVVCGGLHRWAILAGLESGDATDGSWPAIPAPHPDLDVGSYLVPYSYERIRIESPWWYETNWTAGDSAVDLAVGKIVGDLRTRGFAVSAADFIAYRTQLLALAAMRGHASPTRIDVLDAAASTLVDEAQTTPLPWTVQDDSPSDLHPVIASCVATMRGRRFGSLHPNSPVPGLIHHVDMLLEELDLTPGTVTLDLTDPRGRLKSRVLHQLRVLDIPGFERRSGPGSGNDARAGEQWIVEECDNRTVALTEVAALGHTLVDASGVRLESLLRAARFDVAELTSVLFDAVLCGLDSVSDRSGAQAVESLSRTAELADVGLLLRAMLDLWRHDSLLGSRESILLGGVLDAAASRIVELARRTRATAGGADPARIAAIVALSDAMAHAGTVLTEDHLPGLVSLYIDRGAAVDIRGAALGTLWSTTTPAMASEAIRSIPADRLGDWLSGLFAVARESFLDAESSSAVLDAVDRVVADFSDHEFLLALPALRQAFEFFPPRECAVIASRVSEPSPTTIVRQTHSDGAQLDEWVDRALARVGLQ